MSEERRQILEMLAKGQITADEAERLIAALEKSAAASASSDTAAKPKPKYLRVVVDEAGREGRGPMKVNVRVPLQLLRAGVKLANLIPQPAQAKVDDALKAQGVTLHLGQIKAENLEEIIEQFDDLTVDVDDPGKTKVRLYCE